MTNVLAEDFDSIRIGQAVELEFLASEDGQLLPVFRQVAA
jgi:hypothetical protein